MSEVEQILSNLLTRFDKNNDDAVPKSEFKQALVDEGLPQDTVDLVGRKVYANWDKNRDDVLTMSELKQMAEKWASYPGDQSK